MSLLDAGSGEVTATLPTGAGPHEVAVSPDGRRAAIADYGTGEAPGLDPDRDRRAGGAGGQDRSTWATTGGPTAWPGTPADRLLRDRRRRRRRSSEVDPEAGRVRRAIETGQEISHMVAVTPDGARAFVANIGSGSVTRDRPRRGQEARGRGDRRGRRGDRGVAGRPRVWVANRAADTVSVIDAGQPGGGGDGDARRLPDPRRGHARRPVGAGVERPLRDDQRDRCRPRPRWRGRSSWGSRRRRARGACSSFGDESPVPIGIEIAPDGKRAWVAAANADAIVVLDLERWKPAGTLTAGREPDGMGYSPLDVEAAVRRAEARPA